MVDYWFGDGAFAKLPPPVQGFLVKFAPKNAADVKSSFAEALPFTALAGFDRSTIIAYGGASPPIIPTIANALARLLPRAEVLSIPGGTHAMLDTHAEAVAAIINRHAAA
jgi:pimeloyl-ACP methyl ester carboxylesterase